MSGFVARVELEGAFGFGDGAGGIVEPVVRFGGEDVPGGGTLLQAFELGECFAMTAGGDGPLDRGPVGGGQQQQPEHTIFLYEVFALALVFVLAAPAAVGQVGGAQAGRAFIGARACAQCHPEQARKQRGSRHALALRPAGRTGLAESMNARPVRERSGVSFEYADGENAVAVTITQGAAKVEAALEWAFGAGAQAITPVGRRNGRYFEHRLSWYREAGHAARTLGHPGTASETAERAVGIAQDAATITRCFQCHATAVQPGPDLREMQPGVTCERCHGGGAAHVKSASPSEVTRLAGMGAKASVEFCAQCHRMDAERSDPASVRFQPVGLMASRCFQQSGRLSCVTCHDPHADASHDAGFYTAKCLNCHETSGAGAATRARECRRAAGENCLPCHMKRETPFPFLTFTDHRIRVVR